MRDRPNLLVLLCDQLQRHTMGLYGGRDFLCVEFNGYIDGGVHLRAAVSERHKYVYARQDREQFFDLREDPDELRNLADDPAHQSVKQAHRQALAQWMRETGDVITLE